MRWIYRDHKALHYTRKPDEQVLPHVLTTFRHAIDVFGFMVGHRERLTCLDWCERIAASYAASARRDRALTAIQDCMLDTGAPLPFGGEERSLLDYALAGFAGEANLHTPGTFAARARALG